MMLALIEEGFLSFEKKRTEKTMGRLVDAKAMSGIELTARSSASMVDYAERTAKYIPSEIVAAYISLTNIVMSVDPSDTLRWPMGWVIFFLCLAATPLYLNLFSAHTIAKRTHLVIGTVAFGVWGYALGGPFELAGIYKPWLGSVILGLFTLFSGLIIPKK